MKKALRIGYYILIIVIWIGVGYSYVREIKREAFKDGMMRTCDWVIDHNEYKRPFDLPSYKEREDEAKKYAP